MNENTYLLRGHEVPYQTLLETVQQEISAHHSEEVSGLHGQAGAESRMKALVSRTLKNLSLEEKDIARAAPLLYEDMAGTGFLSKYLHNADLEEINVNGWNSTRVNIGGRTAAAPESFLSAQHAQDIVKRIAARSNVTIDEAQPIVRASLQNSTRMIAVQYPIVSRDVGVVASIRRVSASKLTEAQLLRSHAATPEIIEFLYFCIRHGVSICFAGSTGSGKTTTANWLLKKVPRDKRIITIEEGSREFLDLMEIEDGRLVRDYISFLSRKDKNPDLNIDPIRLLDAALWMDPDYVVVGEMRNYEAYVAQETARTGHTVITTTHSNDARSTYRRLMTLCMLYPENRLNEDMMMSLVVEAFPIIVYMKKLEDGSRRIMEVLEGAGYTHEGGLEARTLYRYEVENNERTDKGTIVHGRHVRVNGMSERLQNTLLNNGAEKEAVDEYVA